MDDSSASQWPPFEDEYFDVSGRIDADVHRAAAELWPQAAAFARNTIHDEASGQEILRSVCARITEARAEERIKIRSLKAYISRSYKYEILRKLQTNRLHENLIAAKYEPAEAQTDSDIDQKILIEQIVSKFDSDNLAVFELLVLGHSFEEIGRMLNRPSNRIRSSFSKQLQKIKKELLR